LSAHAGDTWTYENLDAFIHGPQDFASGTKMTFAGLKNDQERANVIAYLSTLSASPLPFPPPAPAESTTAEAVPADGAAVETHGDAVETPTETQSETPVEGTSTGGATEPAAGTEAPATTAPAN
jgi:cytochrome c